jgi:type I restriction enzyme M protein
MESYSSSEAASQQLAAAIKAHKDAATTTRKKLEQAKQAITPLLKEYKALANDAAVLTKRESKLDDLMGAIGGQITSEESKTLILKKLHDLINDELNRYLNAEKRTLIAIAENWWNKYAVSSQTLEQQRAETLAELNGFLSKLGYLG